MSDKEQSERIVISSDDLNAGAIDDRISEMEQARKVALVREVGDSNAKSGGSLRAILTLTISGAVGGFLAFLVNRLLLNTLDIFGDNVFATNLTFTFILAFFIGLSVALGSVITDRSWAKVGMVAAIAAPVAVGAALLLGLLAHWLYSAGTGWLYTEAFDQYLVGDLTEDQVDSFITLRLHPIRGAAWLLVGISAGFAAGAASRSWRRVGLAVLGGAIGGFLGGFIFDFIPAGDGDGAMGEMVAQFVGIVLLGTLIGSAMGLIEQAGKSRWIEIVAGGLAGKQFILYKSEIILGSAPSADITLIKDPAIAPVAARIMVRGQVVTLESADSMTPVLVNGTPEMRKQIIDSDVISIGRTQVRFREKNAKDSVPGPMRH
jgi:hypothetical protein